MASRNEVAAWLRSNSKELLLNDDSEDDMGIDGDRRDIIELSVALPIHHVHEAERCPVAQTISWVRHSWLHFFCVWLEMIVQ